MPRDSIAPSCLAACGSAALLVLHCGSVAMANPATADLNNWMAPCYNDYNYACGLKTSFFAQPGGPGSLPMPFTCQDIINQLAKDGLTYVNTWKPGMAPPTCPAGQCLVAFAADPTAGSQDYHSYRLNADGTWSDKPGQTDAKIFQNNGVNVTDPSTANRGDYTMFCGYFCYAMANVNQPGIGDWLAAPAGGFDDLPLDNCGLPNPTFAYSNASTLEAHLPTGAQIPNPNWPDVSLIPGHFGGYSAILGSGSPFTSTPYFRVYQGVVEEASLDGSIENFFIDNNGLGGYLASQAPAPGSLSAVMGLGVFAVGRRRTRRTPEAESSSMWRSLRCGCGL